MAAHQVKDLRRPQDVSTVWRPASVSEGGCAVKCRCDLCEGCECKVGVIEAATHRDPVRALDKGHANEWLSDPLLLNLAEARSVHVLQRASRSTLVSKLLSTYIRADSDGETNQALHSGPLCSQYCSCIRVGPYEKHFLDSLPHLNLTIPYRVRRSSCKLCGRAAEAPTPR